jgi:hypothetical protein
MTWVVWNLVLVRLEIVLVSVQDGCTVKPNVPLAWKSIWTHMMELLGDVGHVESRFGPFGDGVSAGARLVHGLR